MGVRDTSSIIDIACEDSLHVSSCWQLVVIAYQGLAHRWQQIEGILNFWGELLPRGPGVDNNDDPWRVNFWFLLEDPDSAPHFQQVSSQVAQQQRVHWSQAE